ncbi:RluA family pseudouridine synthase [Pontibacillus litoralis]|uniref:Pseudouridine synthase n=1 Tax=Pontibacillus litoralis JSM 072002 TaxID=1385512 RepID=A0A0A5HVN7_9BACI|nr:RluA family pseudouridine synthase [Pontibacillus litoralis]KGX87712.1 RNA pseudouridine synthase [Pontibacillus litoralis JSM 072002]
MEWIIEKSHDGMLVREYLRTVKRFSRSTLVSVKKDGDILLNEESVTVRACVHQGDCLRIVFAKEERGSHLRPVAKPLTILYEDDELLVVHKPAGLATIPSIHHLEDTLANRVIAYYDKKGIPFTYHVVTRLDVDTSGIVLIAKHRFAHSIMANDQLRGEVNRTYIAFVEGTLKEHQGTIQAPIGRKEGSIIQREVREDGKRAITHYEVLEQYLNFCAVRVKLETGRTHQIRVHFSSIGSPLIGDDLYGGNKTLIQRQALHCSHIQFPHPITRQVMQVKSELPQDIRKMMQHAKGLC